jgi:hypothetical protein
VPFGNLSNTRSTWRLMMPMREQLSSVMFGDEQQRLHRRLPIPGVVFYL